MSNHHYNFQYCPKMIIFSKDGESILLCKRQGEADYDGTFSFPGGKIETTDGGFIEGVNREKDEELGTDFKVTIFPTFTTNVFFTKNDGSIMVIPHMYCVHEGGEISLNKEEYSEYAWVSIEDLDDFEPKIKNIPKLVNTVLRLKDIMLETETITI